MNLPPTAVLRENDLQVGQRVVYPNQGVCRIAGLETKEISGLKAEFLTMKREEDGATVMVPRAKLASIGLRHVAQPAEILAILRFFEAESGDPELDWKVRHRNHAEKMTDGSLTGTAEVLKALHSLAERRPLPQKERELYDSARHLVVNEVAVALSVSRSTAEDTVDLCLTPPAGSPRAQLKAKLKADREEAEEAELLDGLDDLPELPVELAVVPDFSASEPESESAAEAASAEGVALGTKRARPAADQAHPKAERVAGKPKLAATKAPGQGAAKASAKPAAATKRAGPSVPARSPVPLAKPVPLAQKAPAAKKAPAAGKPQGAKGKAR